MFKNYVDQILDFFDPLSPIHGSVFFIRIICLLPFFAHVVFERSIALGSGNLITINYLSKKESLANRENGNFLRGYP